MLLSKTQKVYGCHGSSFGRFGAWFGGKKVYNFKFRLTINNRER